MQTQGERTAQAGSDPRQHTPQILPFACLQAAEHNATSYNKHIAQSSGLATETDDRGMPFFKAKLAKSSSHQSYDHTQEISPIHLV